MASSYCSPSSWPVPRRMARSMFSFGMFSFLPAKIAVRKRGLEFGSPPPIRAAMLISRMIRVKTRPRFASVAPFLCLIVAHFECPDITDPLLFCVTPRAWSSVNEFLRPAAVSRTNGPVAADYHVDRFTVAKKNGTSAETYGEPQTPVNRFAVALSSELPEFSTAVLAAKRVIPHPTPGHPLAFDRLPPADGPKKAGQRPAPRVRSSFAYRAAIALQEK